MAGKFRDNSVTCSIAVRENAVATRFQFLTTLIRKRRGNYLVKKELSFKSMLMGTAVVAAASFVAMAPAKAEIMENAPGAQKAVTLMGMWVDAGAPNGAFTYKDLSGNEAKGTFEADILPLFTQEGIWGNDAGGAALPSCVSCHTAISEESLHEMDLTSYEGLMKGGDSLANPPGVGLLGEAVPGKAPFDWGHSKMRQRLRDNRMPPGIEFDITETNRDGP